jgi:sugar (pentulose or hexulose) kinase
VCVVSLGTSATAFTYSDEPAVDPAGLIAPFCDSTGGFLPLLCVMNATGVAEEVARASGLDLDALTRAAEREPAGSGGLLFLPFLVGERVPDLPHATGALLGIRPGALAPGRLFRAALEGTSLNLAWGFDRLRALGVTAKSVRVVGGGSKNALWRSILADVLGVRVERLREPESAALGAALQAAWCATPGAHIGALCDALVALDGPPVEPNEQRHAEYAALGERFRAETSRLF